MPKDAKTNKEQPKKRPPSKTPEGREMQLISMAMALVEKRLLAGTASSQETTHFLKLGSQKSQLENEILEKQKELITAKTESIKSQQTIELLMTAAMDAMRSYSGFGKGDEEDYD